MTTLVELKNINKFYKKGQVETQALTDVSLQILSGEFIAISGPSGCGKSTLLAILGLLDTPNSGEYQLANIDTHDLNFDQASQVRNQHIGYVFQSFNLIDSLTVSENVALPLEHRNMSTQDIDKEVNLMLEAVNMTERAHHKPTELSGGQQQRVAIARALVGKPDLLLVDEPTGNLDSHNGDAVMHLLKELNEQGTTIVMVTHDERYSQMAKRQIRLFDGKVMMEYEESVA
jgi:putative ABC transport system ATP-binding protein